jgi:hypothetical protein
MNLAQTRLHHVAAAAFAGRAALRHSRCAVPGFYPMEAKFSKERAFAAGAGKKHCGTYAEFPGRGEFGDERAEFCDTYC